MGLPGKSSTVLKKIVNTLVSITCNGKPVSSLYGCVSDGVVCSDHGSCNDHSCTCDAGYKGTYCESTNDSSSSDTGTIIGIVLGYYPPQHVCHLSNFSLTDLLFFFSFFFCDRRYYTSTGYYCGNSDCGSLHHRCF